MFDGKTVYTRNIKRTYLVKVLQLSFCCFFLVFLLFIFGTSSANTDEYKIDLNR